MYVNCIVLHTIVCELYIFHISLNVLNITVIQHYYSKLILSLKRRKKQDSSLSHKI